MVNLKWPADSPADIRNMLHTTSKHRHKYLANRNGPRVSLTFFLVLSEPSLDYGEARGLTIPDGSSGPTDGMILLGFECHLR